MSASLVGSEMCIRDSLRSGCVWDADRVPQAQVGLQARLRTWRGGGSKCVTGSQQQNVGGYQRSATMKVCECNACRFFPENDT
eukprot:3297262-Alexandrium_andersonii.AAC.1